MLVFPFKTAPDLVGNNFETQYSFFLNLSKNLMNATMQLNELNLQAARKLMEESATALHKGVQLRTPADAQSFIAEQSQVTADRIRGYAQNLQNIATENWIAYGKPPGAGATKQFVQPANTNDGFARKDAASHGQHETDPHPSPLVEALVASVVSDVDKLH